METAEETEMVRKPSAESCKTLFNSVCAEIHGSCSTSTSTYPPSIFSRSQLQPCSSAESEFQNSPNLSIKTQNSAIPLRTRAPPRLQYVKTPAGLGYKRRVTNKSFLESLSNTPFERAQQTSLAYPYRISSHRIQKASSSLSPHSLYNFQHSRPPLPLPPSESILSISSSPSSEDIVGIPSTVGKKKNPRRKLRKKRRPPPNASRIPPLSNPEQSTCTLTLFCGPPISKCYQSSPPPPRSPSKRSTTPPIQLRNRRRAIPEFNLDDLPPIPILTPLSSFIFQSDPPINNFKETVIPESPMDPSESAFLSPLSPGTSILEFGHEDFETLFYKLPSRSLPLSIDIPPRARSREASDTDSWTSARSNPMLITTTKSPSISSGSISSSRSDSKSLRPDRIIVKISSRRLVKLRPERSFLDLESFLDLDDDIEDGTDYIDFSNFSDIPRAL